MLFTFDEGQLKLLGSWSRKYSTEADVTCLYMDESKINTTQNTDGYMNCGEMTKIKMREKR